VPRQFKPSEVGVAVLVVVGMSAAGITVGGSAQAASSTGVASVVSATKVQYRAGTGRANTVTVTRSGRVVTIDDKVTVKAGKGCKAVRGDRTKVRCTTSKTPTWARIILGDRNDTLTNKSDLGLTADGGSGNDKLTGGPRGDYLDGSYGNDKLYGLAGDDSVNGSLGTDRVEGGAGDDWVEGHDGNDWLYGGAGHDWVLGEGGNDHEYGGAGDDTFSQGGDPSWADADLLSGGSGQDTVLYFNRDKAITADADGVKGDDGAKGERDTLAPDVEILHGGRGADKLYGTGGADALIGEEGKDVLVGRGGNDSLTGGDGDDRLDGGAGDDWLAGDDSYAGAKHGADVIKGGPGIDRISYEDRTKAVIADLDGRSHDDGQAGERDTLGADIEGILGGTGSDKLTGNASRNTILGGPGNDAVRGGAGDDDLQGDAGKDKLYGEAGDDSLSGSDEPDSGVTADRLDGGSNATARGDYCIVWDNDVSVACERFWPEPNGE
jgi:Ca2+-binding RTX toxin-like protein